MKAFVLCALLALGAASLFRPASSATMSNGGDSTLAAAGSFKVYAMYGVNVGHIHDLQWVTIENGYGYGPFTQGFVFSSLSSLRLKMWGTALVDTSGQTIPAGATFTFPAPIDSFQVLNTGGTSTKVTWGGSR